MDNARKFYINGAWVEPSTTDTIDVINPATEKPIASIAMGGAADVDAGVAAAKAAFETFSQTSVEERIALLDKITELIGARSEEFANTISAEMGAPGGLAKAAQAPTGLMHFATAAQILRNYEFEEQHENFLLVKEPAGVVGMITPWNWPLNQIACKVAPAIATGCTMVLKPSEIAPLNALLFAEVLHDAGVPAGVFNLVNGDGPTVGAHLSSHPDVDMMSFTGSTRAGVEVAKNAAPTVKRVAQELGGKSANIVLPSADVGETVGRDFFGMCMNTGQSCNAGTRILVPAEKMDEAAAAAAAAASSAASSHSISFGVAVKAFAITSDTWLTGIMVSPSFTLSGMSAKSFSFSCGIKTVVMPPRSAASSFSFNPPIARALPRNVTSPVIAMSLRTGIPVKTDTMEVTIAKPALGPSFGVAASGTCT